MIYYDISSVIKIVGKINEKKTRKKIKRIFDLHNEQSQRGGAALRSGQLGFSLRLRLPGSNYLASVCAYS